MKKKVYAALIVSIFVFRLACSSVLLTPPGLKMLDEPEQIIKEMPQEKAFKLISSIFSSYENFMLADETGVILAMFPYWGILEHIAISERSTITVKEHTTEMMRLMDDLFIQKGFPYAWELLLCGFFHQFGFAPDMDHQERRLYHMDSGKSAYDNLRSLGLPEKHNNEIQWYLQHQKHIPNLAIFGALEHIFTDESISDFCFQLKEKDIQILTALYITDFIEIHRDINLDRVLTFDTFMEGEVHKIYTRLINIAKTEDLKRKYSKINLFAQYIKSIHAKRIKQARTGIVATELVHPVFLAKLIVKSN